MKANNVHAYIHRRHSSNRSHPSLILPFSSGSRSLQRVSLGVQNPPVQVHDRRFTEDEVEILQRLGQPETLHAVALLGHRKPHVVHGGVGDGRLRGRVDALEHGPRRVLQLLVARDPVEYEDGLDGLGAKNVPIVPLVRVPDGEAVLVDELLAHFRGGRVPRRGGGVLLPDGLVPLRVRPLALPWRRGVDADLARGEVEGLGHEARGHGVVRPEAPVDEPPGDRQVVRAAEDLGSDPDHPSDEAGEVLSLRFEARDGDRLERRQTGVAAEQEVLAAGHERPEEEVPLGGLDGFLVHVLVLPVAATEHHPLLRQVLVRRIGHAAHREVVDVERERLRVDDGRPQARDLGLVLRRLHRLRYPLYHVKVLHVPGDLTQPRELDRQTANLREQSVGAGFDLLPDRRHAPLPPRHGHVVGRVERRVQYLTQLAGLVQQGRIPTVGKVVRGEESAEVSYRGFKDVDHLLLAGREVDLLHGLDALLKVFLQVHDPERVHGVDECRAPSAETHARRPTDGADLVCTPCVFLVPVPRVDKCISDDAQSGFSRFLLVQRLRPQLKVILDLGNILDRTGRWTSKVSDGISLGMLRPVQLAEGRAATRRYGRRLNIAAGM